MKRSSIENIAMMIVLIAISFCHADTTETRGISTKQSGFMGVEVGEIMHGANDNHAGGIGEINRGWCERMLFQYVNDITVTDHVRLNLAVECQMSYSFPYWLYASWEAKLPKFTFYPDRAEGTYTIGNPDLFRFQFGFGYFPYKTDPDVKNLGEYLFRTGTYPLYVLNNFNRPYSRLLGLRTSFTVLKDLNIDALLTSATLAPPLANFSLSFIADYNFFKILDFCTGVSLVSLFPVDEKLTTPTGNDATNYIDAQGDTSNYTFKGIKPMARLSFDPKPLIPWNGFGKQDLRVYSEVCVSGWQNYKNYDTSAAGIARDYYEKRSDRTLYMIGVNFPSFFTIIDNILSGLNIDPPVCSFILKTLNIDLLSLEYEYMPGKYPNSTLNLLGVTNQPVPAPNLNPSSGPGSIYPWYWSIYAKKEFLERFAFIVQFARDHMRPINNDPAYQYVEDVLERKGDWWWAFRLNVSY